MTERHEKKKGVKRRGGLKAIRTKPKKKSVKRRNLKLSKAAELQGRGYDVVTFWGSISGQIDILTKGKGIEIPKSILKKKM